MHKKTLLIAVLTLLFPLTVHAEVTLTNDMTAAVKLKADDFEGITTSSEYEYRWAYLDKDKKEHVLSLDDTGGEYVKGLSSVNITFKEYGNGTYILKTRADGQVKEQAQLNVKAYDIKAPYITDYEISPSEYCSEVTLTVKSVDEDMGLADKPYRLCEIRMLEKGYEYVKKGEYQSEDTFIIKKNGMYLLSARDSVGNEGYRRFSVSQIDTDDPKIEDVSITNNNGLLTVKVTASDPTEKTEELSYALSADSESPAAGWQNSNSLTTVDGKKIDTTGTYYIFCKDKVGHVVKQKLEIDAEYMLGKLPDMTKSDILSYVKFSTSSYTNENVTLSVGLPKKMKGAKYNFNNEGFKEDNTYTVSNNGTYSLKIQDEFGNIYESDPIEVHLIDRAVPEFTAKMNKDKNQLIVTLKDEDNGSYLKQVTLRGGDYIDATVIKSYDKDTYRQSIFTIDIPAIGSYTIEASDYAGNRSSATINIKEAHTGNTELNTKTITDRLSVASNGWSNTSARVTLKLLSTDGLCDEPYKWSAGGVTSEVYTTANYIDVSQNGDVTVTVKDQFGNEFKSDPIKITSIDRTAPEITTTVNKDDATLSIVATDKDSHVKKVCLEGVGIMGVETIKEYALATEKAELSYTLPYNGAYKVHVYDDAGNESIKEVTASDIILPNPLLNPNGLTSSILISTGDYTQNPVTLTVLPKNILGYTLVYKFETSAGVIPEQQPFVGNYGISNQLTLTSNGKVSVYTTDAWGTTIKSKEITVSNIDTDKPELTAEFSTSNQIKVKAKDDGSGLYRITYTVNDTPYVYKTYLTEVKSEDVSIPVYENGTYRVFVYDRAGNFSDAEVLVEDVHVNNESLTEKGISSALSVTPSAQGADSATLQFALNNKEGLARRPYSWDGGETWTDCPYKDIAKNGVYEICVKDLFGSVTKGQITVTNLKKDGDASEETD